MLARLFTRLRTRLTYANVVSTLCLFILLGGTAWAVANNSVGTKQLKDGAVTHAKLAANSVSSGNVIDGSLAWSDVGGSLRTLIKGRCPLGSRGVPMDPLGTDGELCIDHYARGPDLQFVANRDCGQSGFSLPTWGELSIAYEAGLLNPGSFYWSDELVRDADHPLSLDAVDLGAEKNGMQYATDLIYGPATHYYACVGLPMQGF